MSTNDLFDQFLSIIHRINTMERIIQSEQQAIVHYQFRIRDPYTPYTLGCGNLNILDDLRFLVRQKEVTLKILQKHRNSLKVHFNDLLIQILLQR